MRAFVLGVGGGAWWLQQQASLPTWPTIALYVAAAAVACLAARSLRVHKGVLLLASGVAAGFGWAATHAHWRMADRLPAAWEGRDIVVTGVVASLPQRFERGLRFHFDVTSAADEAPVPSRLALSWYDTGDTEAVLQPGERWRFTVRLKRPHGSANPHGFDYEVWLLERGIGATGYVRTRDSYTRLVEFVPHPAYVIERARAAVRDKFYDALPAHRYAGVLVALAVGDQRAIEPEDWRLYIRTGVGHLMSISGLHVTMVAGLCAWLVHFAWRRSSHLLLALPARKAAALGGALAALIYCLLAGFAVPAQRTLYMLSVVALAFWCDRMQSSSRVLSLALLVVLVLDPWAIISPGFWLSFGAVALMLYVGVMHDEVHWVVRWARVQWAISLGLAPLLLLLFQHVSLVSPLANAIAIPVVSLVVTPLALLAAVAPGPWIALLAHAVLEPLMRVLEWFGEWPVAVWEQHAPAPWTLLPALIGIVWMLAPRGVPARWLGILLLLPLYAVAPARPATGEAWLDVLDVGQGLAMVVRTRDHTLLYDAGPAYGEEANAGDRVVLPFMRGAGLTSLDALVVSHADNDHAGGALAVAQAKAVPVLWSSLEVSHPAHQAVPSRVPCRAGVQWEWDGVRFAFLHPPMALYEGRARTNRRSCVLRIDTAHGAALLTGDIEAGDEQLLLRAGAPLHADVLIAPHHGSKTSSTSAFIDAVQPRHVVFTVGYRNRFGHPHPDVLARYVAREAAIWRSDRDGAISVRLGGGVQEVRAYRRETPRYWR